MVMPKLTIIIPSRNERFLNNTIKDVLEKATGDIEVFPVLDGYELPADEIVQDKRVKYLHLDNTPTGRMQKRQGVNMGVALSTGDYVMSLDAHCLMAQGFDEVLTRDCQDDWIITPRRRKLDAANWCVKEEETFFDYAYWMWRRFITGELLEYHWDERTAQRLAIPIDETLTHQGSCWVMKKDWFLRNGFMQVEGYTGWGQESEEICLTTWSKGGKVMTDKNTWYAHLYKGKQWGRMYFMSKAQKNESIDYSYNYWVRENLDKFEKIIDKFMPIPNWPDNWQKYICKTPCHL